MAVKKGKETQKKVSMSELVKKLAAKSDDKDLFYSKERHREIECIDTGSIIINKVIGLDGIPKGRITEIFGMESSGKSTLVQSLAIQCLKNGGKVLYLDYEQAFDTEYARKQGLDIDDPDTFILAQPKTFEEGFAICREFLDCVEGLDLIIIDSVAAMTPSKILNAEIEKELQIGLMARHMAQFCAEMTKTISKTNTAMVVVNQVRSRIKTNMYDAGPDTDTTGGKALKFYASLRLELRHRKIETISTTNDIDGTPEDKPVGMLCQVINRKNKVANPYRKAEFAIRFGEGIDNVRSVIDVSENLGLIKKAGAWFNFRKDIPFDLDEDLMTQEGKMQGLETVREYLVKHTKVLATLVDNIYVEKDDEVERESKKDDLSTTGVESGNFDAIELNDEEEAAIAEAQSKVKKSKKKAKEVEIE
jgi:recombination protein RecA